MSSLKAHLTEIAANLHQMVESGRYNWHGSMQTDKLDERTEFIYYAESLADCDRRSALAGLSVEETDYAAVRWYNHQTHDAVMAILASKKGRVRLEPNLKHRTRDLFIDHRPFDLKLSVYPKAFDVPLWRYLSLPADKQAEIRQEMIAWFYKKQSTGKRKHTENRLFVVLPDWKEKADLFKIHRELSIHLARGLEIVKYKKNEESEEVEACLIPILD